MTKTYRELMGKEKRQIKKLVVSKCANYDKEYCLYSLCGNRGYQKELTQRRREARQDRICKCCGKAFTPKRSDAVYCSNACRQKAYRQNVADNASSQVDNLP